MLLGQGLEDDFTVRRELINYKKVCLHIWHGATQLERELQQLVTFFFRDITKTEDGYMHSARYVALCQALQQCIGAIDALLDARFFTKAIASIPRHPEKCHLRHEKLLRLPDSLAVAKILKEATSFLKAGMKTVPSRKVNPEHIRFIVLAKMVAVDAVVREGLGLADTGNHAISTYTQQVCTQCMRG